MRNYSNVTVMLAKVEEARDHMNNLAHKYPLTSEEVVNASTELDKLLNELYEFNHY